MDTASREAMGRHLYSPDELLRMDQLEVDRRHLAEQEESRAFGERLGPELARC